MNPDYYDDMKALRQEWKRRSELCRKARQKERHTYLYHIRKAALSVSITLMFVFGLSAWVVSWILPFKQSPLQEKKVLYDPEPWTPETPAWMLEAMSQQETEDLSVYHSS